MNECNEKKYSWYFGVGRIAYVKLYGRFLERNPFGSIDETTFFTEPEHADLAAIACYSKLQN